MSLGKNGKIVEKASAVITDDLDLSESAAAVMHRITNLSMCVFIAFDELFLSQSNARLLATRA
jgi:hypothetical protein